MYGICPMLVRPNLSIAHASLWAKCIPSASLADAGLKKGTASVDHPCLRSQMPILKYSARSASRGLAGRSLSRYGNESIHDDLFKMVVFFFLDAENKW